MIHTTRILLVIAFLVSPAFGADVVFSIAKAELSCRSNGGLYADSIHFVFDKSLKANELVPCDGDPECLDKQTKLRDWINGTLRAESNYHLMRISDGALAILNMPDPETGILDNVMRFSVSGYDLSGGYMLIAKSISNDKPGPFMIKVEPNSSCERVSATQDLPEPEQIKEKKEEQRDKKLEDYFSKPAFKESPILKVNFGLQGAKKKRSVYSFDVEFRPYTTRRQGFGGQYELTYFFVDTEYRINATESDKKDVLNVGIFDFRWMRVFRDDGGELSGDGIRRFPGVSISLTPKLETDWRFKEQNLVVSPKIGLPINVYQSRGTTWQITPFIGIDFGYKRRSEVLKPGWKIQRPFAGASLTANFLRKDDKPRLAFQVDYIRRFFLEPELSYGYDANGKEVPDRQSKIPRDHAKMKFTFNATELFSPFIEYEYGRVPPKYTLLNSSFRTGIQFDVDMVWKNFR